MICGLECKFFVYCTDTEDYLEETGPRGTAAFIRSVPFSLLMVLAILKEKSEGDSCVRSQKGKCLLDIQHNSMASIYHCKSSLMKDNWLHITFIQQRYTGSKLPRRSSFLWAAPWYHMLGFTLTKCHLMNSAKADISYNAICS